MKKTALRFDPRSGLILLALVNIIAFTFQEPWLELLTVSLLALLQLLCGCAKSTVRWLTAFLTLVLIQYFLLPVMPKSLAVIMTIFTVFARKIFPCLMMGSLIIQTVPVRYFRGLGAKIQCSMIPLLVSAIQTSDELSAAAITRGIENPCPKTCAEELRFSGFDWASLCIAGLLAVISLFFA